MLYSLDPLNNQYKGTQEILEIKKKKKKCIWERLNVLELFYPEKKWPMIEDYKIMSSMDNAVNCPMTLETQNWKYLKKKTKNVKIQEAALKSSMWLNYATHYYRKLWIIKVYSISKAIRQIQGRWNHTHLRKHYIAH